VDTFTMSEHHLALLRRSYIEEGDNAAEVNQKRPYGNSDIITDVAEIISGIDESDFDSDENEDRVRFDKEGDLRWIMDTKGVKYTRDDLEELHKQTVTALQIVLVTGVFEPGEYQTTQRYDRRSWVRVNGPQ
jgi:hypothetical protein